MVRWSERRGSNPRPLVPQPTSASLVACCCAPRDRARMCTLHFGVHDVLRRLSQAALGQSCCPPLSTHVYWAGVGYFEPRADQTGSKSLKLLARPTGLEPVFSP